MTEWDVLSLWPRYLAMQSDDGWCDSRINWATASPRAFQCPYFFFVLAWPLRQPPLESFVRVSFCRFVILSPCRCVVLSQRNQPHRVSFIYLIATPPPRVLLHHTLLLCFSLTQREKKAPILPGQFCQGNCQGNSASSRSTCPASARSSDSHCCSHSCS